MKPAIRITLQDDQNEKFFGEGPCRLLKAIEKTGSLRSAAISMDMAYSKAWRIIRTAEEVFGCKLLDSTTGGRNGGGAILTPQAERLLSAYNAYVADLKAYADGKFREAFGFYRTMDKI